MDLDELIKQIAAAGRDATSAELQQIREHVAAAGFDPLPVSHAGGRIAGLQWRGQILQGSARLPAAEVHYLRHAVAAQEWPPGTSLAAYIESIRTLVRNPASGVFISRYLGTWQIGFAGRSDALRGPQGADWVLVEYRAKVGRWVTAYQLPWNEILGNLSRRDVRWLNQPT